MKPFRTFLKDAKPTQPNHREMNISNRQAFRFQLVNIATLACSGTSDYILAAEVVQ